MAYIEAEQGTDPTRTAPKPRYTAPKTRYTEPAPSAPAPSAAPQPIRPVLEIQTARYDVLPAEVAALSRVTNLSILNDTETVVAFVTTDGIMSWEGGLTRDLTNLNKLYVTGVPSRMVFEISFYVAWAADADGYRQVAIDNNDGTAYRVLSLLPAVATASIPTVQTGSIKLRRQELDTYYQLKVRHTAGAALNITAAQIAIVRFK